MAYKEGFNEWSYKFSVDSLRGFRLIKKIKGKKPKTHSPRNQWIKNFKYVTALFDRACP